MKSKKSQIIEKKRKERFELLPTSLSGVQLKLEPGTKLNLSQRRLKTFYSLVKRYTKKQWRIDKLSGQQKERREEIVNMAKSNDGFRGIISRGIISKRNNFSLTVFPSETVIWNREILKESMGLVYPMAVSETLTISVSISSTIIPDKKRAPIREKAAERAIKKALISLGIPRKDLAKVIHKEVSLNVDEERLNEMVRLRQVKLSPETKKSEVT